jgi:hypothetical protein
MHSLRFAKPIDRPAWSERRPVACEEVPIGVPLVYDARIALGRLWQLYRRIVQAPTLPHGYRWRSDSMPEVVKELAADCDITVGPSPGRVVVRCPSCGTDAYRLHGARHGWVCRRCDGVRWSQVELMIGSYAMGACVGYTGQAMKRRRDRLIGELNHTVRAGRSARDLSLIALGATVLQYSPRWQRRAPGQAVRLEGPVWRSVRPHMLGAIIDQLLHPSAFFQRFSRAD